MYELDQFNLLCTKILKKDSNLTIIVLNMQKLFTLDAQNMIALFDNNH